MSVLEELKRRNVFKVGLAYAIAAWLLVQVVVSIEAPLRLPDWTDTLVILLLIIGFPAALILSWLFDVTPEGIKRTASTKNRENSTSAAGSSSPATLSPGKSVAVLPFTNMSSDPEQEYFSDGISEELLNLLCCVPDLKVIARTSSFSYKGKAVPITQISRELNVDQILESLCAQGR